MAVFSLVLGHSVYKTLNQQVLELLASELAVPLKSWTDLCPINNWFTPLTMSR